MAVLQLRGTPWIEASFHTKDVVFHTQKSVTAASLLAPAFVSRSSDRAQRSETITSTGRQFSRNALVFALGVILLELSYGRPLIDLALADELDANGAEKPETELLVARRLLDDIGSRETNKYSDATASCVNCDVGQPRQSSLDHDDFRAGFIECVVEPLRIDYEMLYS